RAAGGAEVRDDRHLRRPSDGDVLFARGACAPRGTHRRSGLRTQDVSRLLRGPRNRIEAMSAPAGGTEASADSVPVIAVAGPAASGKGTIAAGVAAELGFHLLDSGALYRVVALKAKESGVPLDAAADLAELARKLDVTFSEAGIAMEGREVAAEIRGEWASA